MVRRAAIQTRLFGHQPPSVGCLDDTRRGQGLRPSLKYLDASSQASLHVAGRSTQFDVHCSNQRLYLTSADSPGQGDGDSPSGLSNIRGAAVQ